MTNLPEFTKNIYNAKRKHCPASPRTLKVRQLAFPRKQEQEQTYNLTCKQSTCQTLVDVSRIPDQKPCCVCLQKQIILGVTITAKFNHHFVISISIEHSLCLAGIVQLNKEKTKRMTSCNRFAQKQHCNLARRCITTDQWMHNASLVSTSN